MSFEAETAELDRVHAELMRRAPNAAPGRLPAKADPGGYDATWLDVRGYPPHFIYALLYRERSHTRIVLQSNVASDFVDAVLRSPV